MITVRGSAISVDSSIEKILVNDVEATDLSDDGSYSVWSASVGLDVGPNTLQVSAEDAQGVVHNNLASVAITRNPDLGNFPNEDVLLERPISLSYDPSSNQVIIGDGDLNRLLAVDLNTGQRSHFVPQASPADIPLLEPAGILTDIQGGRLWVTDAEGSRLTSVSLSNKTKAIVSEDSQTNATSPLGMPSKLTFDARNSDRLMVLDRAGRLVSVNTSTGDRELFSSNALPDENMPFDEPLAIAYNGQRGSYLVGTAKGQLLAVNGQTGTRSLVSDSETPSSESPRLGRVEALTAFNDPDRVLALSKATSGAYQLISVDLDSGQRTLIADTASPNGDNRFETPTDIAYVKDLDLILMMDDGYDALLAVDPNSGERTFLSKGKNTTNIGQGCECDLSVYDQCMGTQIAQHRENGLIGSTIVYNFAEPILCGTFRNGYDYVVAPTTANGTVTLSSVLPEAVGTGSSLRHGLTVNPNSPTNSNLDGRLGTGSVTEPLPLSIDTQSQSISSVLKAESWNIGGSCNDQIGPFRRMCFQHIDVLTVLNEWPSGGPKNYLRPAFWGTDKDLHSLSSIDLSILSNVLPKSRPSGAILPDSTINEAIAYMNGLKADYYQDYPGVQTLKGFANWPGITSGYSPNGWGKFWDHAQWLYLDPDAFGFSQDQKNELAYRTIEHGMDVLEIVLNYPTYGPWAPNGGHTSGRYGAAVIAAVLQHDGSDLAALNSRLATPSGPHTFSETGQISPGDGYAIYGQTTLPGGKAYFDCTVQTNSTVADNTGRTDISDYNHPEGGNCVYSDSQSYQDVVWNLWLSQATVLSAMPETRAQTDDEFLDYVNRIFSTGTKSHANQDPDAAVVDVYALGHCSGGSNDGLVAFFKSQCPGGSLVNAIAPNFQNPDYASQFGTFMFEQLQTCLSGGEGCDLK